MLRVLSRALVTAIIGTLAGALALASLFSRQPGLSLEMDRDLPRVTSGFHPVEIVGEESFAWTGRSAVLRLQGADRRAPWVCAVRVRGGRSAPLPQPDVELAADGITLGRLAATNEYQILEVTVPAQRSRSGLVLTVTSSTTFVPGPADKRELGVQVDRISCRRDAGSLGLPPPRATTAATTSAAVFGAAFSLVGLTLPAAIAATAAVAIGQAVPLTAGPAPYTAYPGRAAALAWWIALVAIGATLAIERWRRTPLTSTARFVVAFSAAALFLQLLALLHPSKLVVDALFHAHRLQWVLGGRYYFTQPMPDGVQFPYAIALYVFAAPWSVLTQDHVSLLRIIVSAVHALAGALLYPIVVRTWNDRVAGAIAVVLFHLVPLPYVVIGHANLTYAFGQSTAFVTIAACVAFAMQARQIHQAAVLFVLASLAFLSHVGVLPVLLTTMMAIGVLNWFIGGAQARAPGQWIVLAAACAAVFSVVTYYGQFTEVYKSLDRVRGGRVATVAPPQNGAAPEASHAPAAIPLHRRARTAAALAVRAFGWPVVLLAAAGVWRLWHGGGRDRLTLALAGAALTSCIFVALAAATPVEPRFQKYSDEFIDRVNYATVPVVVILAARAASWTWNRGVAARAATALLLTVAAAIGLRQWIGWFN